MSKHTPGPWGIAGKVMVQGPNKEPILSMRKNDEEIEANCRLISEAPAMYDLLLQLVEACSLGEMTVDEVWKINEQSKALLTRINPTP